MSPLKGKQLKAMASMFCFVVFLFLSISVCAAQAPWNASQFLTTACNQTPSPDLCVKHLLKFNESLTADIHLLTGLMVRAAAQYAKETAENVFGEQHDESSADPVYETCLHDCSESIEDAIQQLDDTTKAVDMRAFKDVEDWVAAAVADASTCNESCTGANGGQSEIKQLNDMTVEFTELCKVILALSKLDAQGQH